MSHIHENVRCDACDKSSFRLARYKCLICVDFDLCGNCFSKKREAFQHEASHPMQCILLSSDLSEFFAGQPNMATYTCPYCGNLGLDQQSFSAHIHNEHSTNSDSEVLCPLCFGHSTYVSNVKYTNLSSHLVECHKLLKKSKDKNPSNKIDAYKPSHESPCTNLLFSGNGKLNDSLSSRSTKRNMRLDPNRPCKEFIRLALHNKKKPIAMVDANKCESDKSNTERDSKFVFGIFESDFVESSEDDHFSNNIAQRTINELGTSVPEREVDSLENSHELDMKNDHKSLLCETKICTQDLENMSCKKISFGANSLRNNCISSDFSDPQDSYPAPKTFKSGLTLKINSENNRENFLQRNTNSFQPRFTHHVLQTTDDSTDRTAWINQKSSNSHSRINPVTNDDRRQNPGWRAFAQEIICDSLRSIRASDDSSTTSE